MCDGFAFIESENAFFEETYFDDDEEESSLFDDLYIDERRMSGKFNKLELSLDGRNVCLDETSEIVDGIMIQGYLSEINELSDLLEIMDEPKEISDIKARIRGKRLQFLMGLQKEKILREDLLQLILLHEERSPDMSESESDELLDAIFTHENFLDELCPLQLERRDAFREQETPQQSFWLEPDLVLPCSP